MIFETAYICLQKWGVFSSIDLLLDTWGWIFPPVFFFFTFSFFYKWWINWEVWYAKNKFILLRIIPPKEVKNTFKAMQDVYNLLFGVRDAPNWKESWCEGVVSIGPWISWEITCIGGKISFYVKCLEGQKSLIEDNLYSHFPEIEIQLAEDYTQKVPQDVPNKTWDVYSEDYTVLKAQALPIKTYPFFDEKPDSPQTEDVRIDPLDSMLEAMARMNPSEQLWFQMVIVPMLPEDGRFDCVAEGKALIDKIAQRPSSSKKGSGFSVLKSIVNFFLWGDIEKQKDEKPADLLSAPELRLISGEKDKIKAIENKISQQLFKTYMRIVYLNKRNEPYFKGNYKIFRTYFNHFVHADWNGPVFWGPTRAKIHYWFVDRRLYLRKRKNFRNYVARLPSLFPRTLDGEPFFEKGIVSRSPGLRGTAILCTEELATIYHFPYKISPVIAPAILPIESKKSGPPVGLPMQ
jgi:hypothetical protein